VFISHDLGVVRHVCDRIAVMYLGRIVEIARVDRIFSDPRHPYTRALLDAMPSLDPNSDFPRVEAGGDPPSPYRIPSGCRFHPRCPVARELCTTHEPDLASGPGTATDTHRAACHFAWEDERAER
jgi:peptide/nickel transport system ATP-binding protein